MRLFNCVLLIVMASSASAQTFNIKSLYLDSLLFMATKYKSCDSVRVAQADELESQGKLLLHTNTALKLSQSESSTLQGLLKNEKEGRANDGRQADLDKSVMKQKIKKRNILIVGQTMLLILLLIP